MFFHLKTIIIENIFYGSSSLSILTLITVNKNIFKFQLKTRQVQ